MMILRMRLGPKLPAQEEGMREVGQVVEPRLGGDQARRQAGDEDFFLHDLHRSSVVSQVVRPVHPRNGNKHVVVPTGGSPDDCCHH
jgi:predicted polyphosphate/ATP-dependent NAD kinase